MVFALPERFTMQHILKNHNIHNVDDKKFIEMYKKATADPLNFFMIDTKNKATGLRHNWNTEIFKV
jgi:rRNA pseudouridine-1189 N-methylase Emg1 (Nep1/Mra1 family)